MAENQNKVPADDRSLLHDLAIRFRPGAGAEVIDVASLHRNGFTPAAPGGLAGLRRHGAADRGGHAIALDIATALADVRDTEGLVVTFAGMPGDVTLSAGTDNGDGTWTLGAGQIDDLNIILPADSGPGATFPGATFDVTAYADGDLVRTLARLEVTLEADMDPVEDDAIGLDIAALLADIQGAEGLPATISGVPDGARLSAGTDRGGGTWTLGPDHIDGLAVTLPADHAGDLTLRVTVTTGPDTVRAQTVARLEVTIETLPETSAPRFAGTALTGAANALKPVIGKVVDCFTKYNFDKADMMALLGRMIDQSLDEAYGDFPGAEQATMVMSAIVNAMIAIGVLDKKELEPINASLAKCLVTVGSDKAYSPPAFMAALRAFKAKLRKWRPSTYGRPLATT